MKSSTRLRCAIVLLVMLESLITADGQCSSAKYPTVYYNAATISSPNYPLAYSNNADCHWRIMSTASQYVSLIFDSFQTEFCCDKVFIYNGYDMSATLLAELSGNVSLSTTYNTTQAFMFIRFKSDVAKTYKGFSARASSNIVESCHPETIPLEYYDAGTLSSPNFPSMYPREAECHWRIEATKKKMVSLQFDRFQLNSCCDKVYIFDGYDTSSEELARLTGTVSSSTVYKTTQSYMYIIFSADSSRNTGFIARYSSTKKTISVFFNILGVAVGFVIFIALLACCAWCDLFDKLSNLCSAVTSCVGGLANRATRAIGNVCRNCYSSARAKVYRAEQNNNATGSGNGEGNSATQCTICYNADANCVFVGCGHMTTCMTCGNQLDRRCPICRGISSVQRVYTA